MFQMNASNTLTKLPSGKRSHSWLENPPFLIGKCILKKFMLQPAMLVDTEGKLVFFSF